MLAHGRLLVDDPERIGPVQANGMDQTLFNRVGEYRTQQWATTFDSPLKPEGRLLPAEQFPQPGSCGLLDIAAFAERTDTRAVDRGDHHLRGPVHA